MKRMASVLISVVLLLSITAGISISAYAGVFGYIDPLANKYVIDERANQFDFFECYRTIEDMKLLEQGKSPLHDVDYDKVLDGYAQKLGIINSNGKPNTNLSEYERVAKIYQYVHLTHTYDVTKTDGPYVAFITRMGICETFSRTVNEFCKRAGIESWLIGSVEANHAFNLVKIDGKYYRLDIAQHYFLTSPVEIINKWKTDPKSDVYNAEGTKYYPQEGKSGTGIAQWLSAIGSSNLATSTYSKITIDKYGDLINPKTTLSTPSVVSTTATSEGVIVKFKGVSNADWYEVYTAPIDGVMNGVSTTSFDSSKGDFVTKNYSGDFVYYVSDYPLDYRRFNFEYATTVYSIDKNESGQYQCFLENGDRNGIIVFVVAKNVKGETNVVTTSPLPMDTVPKVISLIGKNYLPSCAGKDGSKSISGASAAQINSTNYALYKSNAKHLATNGNHSYTKIKTIRAAGAGTQGADLYECKNCLQRQIRYTDAKMLSTPKLSAVENTTTGVKITWGKVSGAAKYRVFYKTSGGSWTKIADTTSTSYTWTKAKSGTKYTFTVRCVSSDGKSFTSDYDKTGKSITYIAAPKLSSVSNTATGVKITWDKSSGAAKYRLFYKTAGGSWTKIADTTSTSYTWTKAKSGTKYTFTVRCVDKDGKNYTSSYNSTGKTVTYIAAPKLSSVSNTATGVQIKWSKSAGAAKYRVFYKTSNGKWTKIADTTSTSYTWTKAKSGTKYTFTVRCIDKDGKNFTSSYDSKGKTITYLSAPKISSLTKNSTGITIKWDKVAGAAKYRVFYKTGNGSWQKLTDTTSTSFTWKGGKKGTKYTFTVRCISKDGKTYTSGYDSKGKSITK